MMNTPKWKRYLILFVGLLENLIFTGSILGWSSLNFMLKEEGVFSHLCAQIHHPLSSSLSSPGNTFFFNESSVEYIVHPSKHVNNSHVTYWISDDEEKSTNSSVFYANNVDLETTTSSSSLSSSPSSLIINSSSNIKLPVCHVQERLLNLAYTLGTFFNGFTAFIWGFLLEKWGLRRVRLLINFFLTFGSLLLCFTTRDRSFLVFPAIIIFCFGGVPLRIADMQIANLFPKNRSFVISLYSGAFSASAITFVILKLIWEIGVPFRWTCGLLVASSLAMLPVTFFLLPSDVIRENDSSESEPQLTFSNGKFMKNKNLQTATSTVSLTSFKSLSSPKIKPKTIHVICHNNNNNHSNHDRSANYSPEPLSKNTISSQDLLSNQEKINSNNLSAMKTIPLTSNGMDTNCLKIPLKLSIYSLPFMLHQWWFSWLITYMIMYVGTMNLWLNRVVQDKSTASFFYKLYGSTQVTSLILAPLTGFWLDYRLNIANNYPDPLKRRIHRYKAGFWPLFLTTSSLAGILICRFFDTKLAIYLSIFFITILRALLVAVGSAFLRIRFPGEHFGKLLGIMSTVGAIISLLQFPLFVWEASYPSHAIWVNTFSCVLTAFAYLNPLHYCFDKLQKKLIHKSDQKIAEATATAKINEI